jgi:hypothetical protein
MSKTTPPQSTSKKWYEDDDLTVTENTNTKEAQRQSEFGPGIIGTEFNAIKVKLQETYEVGILKIFIETEVLRSGSNEFEPGLKQLYEPERMTKPFNVGKELLFTSDVEFSEAGFLPGSLQDDRRKYFLNLFEFNKYLLRLPKPISDIETPVEEKADSNAYKYLQILGDEKSNRILMICNDFKRHNDDKERENVNAIIKLQKELDDAKKLVVDVNMTQAKKTKLQEDIERQLTNEQNKKIKLETKYKNYKAACKILSSTVRRMQYDATLVESFPATIKDGNSLSTTIVEWLKYKQNNPNFFKEVLTIFKPIHSDKVQKDKETISEKINEVVRSLSSIFKPIIESYFYDKLATNLLIVVQLATERILNDVVVPANRINDPVKYSWKNLNSSLKRVFESRFGNVRDKNAVNELLFISKFMINFQSDILRTFTFNKKDGGIERMIEEITANNSVLNTGNVVNILYHNIVYLKAMLNKMIEAIQTVYYAQPMAAPPLALAGLDAALLALGLLPAQQLPAFLVRLKALRQLVDALETSVRDFRLTVATNSYKTILGEASHAAFVESIFSEKIPPISHANRNNKFLVVSDFITDVYDNSPVTITIPDDYYDLYTLSGAIEKELCEKCKWKVDANVPNQNRDTIWSCKYDENKKIQLNLYFPQNDLMNVNNIIPNIHHAYPAGFIRPGAVAVPENNIFQVSGGYIRAGVVKTLTIPQGEYRDIQHLLGVMAKTINDFIGNESNEELTQAYKTNMSVTLDAANHVKFEFKSTNADKLRLAVNETAAARLALAAAVGTLAIARANTVLGVKVADEARIRRLLSNTENEVLNVTLNNVGLSRILGSIAPGALLPPVVPPYTFNSAGPTAPAGPSDEFTMGNLPAFPLPSKSVEIKTRMQIDGDEYDASVIFGVPSSVAPDGVITMIPEITIRELALAKNENNQNKLKVNEMLDDYLGFSRLPAPLGPIILERISDYGILNFTSGTGFRVTIGNPPVLATTTLDAVDLSKIVNKANSANAKLKTEVMEKTGLYINNSLLKAKVPVITSTDILNSLFYRYPCIPSAAAGLLEGTPEFDKFIEERVNVSKFKEVVWLGKGINDTSETLSLTIRKALDKTLMYDDCDEERSKLMCDLHYAICGPVFTNTALRQQNQYGEIDELEMFHQFQLEIKRPDTLNPGPPALVAPRPRPVVKPFTVKGITPYYDNASKSYKYLIYGHYLDFTQPAANRQIGCVKYYDPGTKIGPQPKASQLYDILRFGTPAGSTTVNSVVEMYPNDNNNTETFVYPVFRITGVFNNVEHLDEYGNNVNANPPFAATNIVAWTTGKNGLGFPYDYAQQPTNRLYNGTPGSPTLQEINRILAAAPPPLLPSNTFTIFWKIMNRVVGFPLHSRNLVYTLNLNSNIPLTQVAVMNASPPNSIILFSLNIFYSIRFCIITKTIANDNTKIFIPYTNGLGNAIANEILQVPAGVNDLKISCGAVSINKDVCNIVKEINFYRREYCSTITTFPVNQVRLANIQNKIDSLTIRIFNPGVGPRGLQNVNPLIKTNLLWIGLKEQLVAPPPPPPNVVRDILSCSLIDVTQIAALVPVDLPLPVTFSNGDFIEKIKIDINDPEIVTVFGKFTATIRDIPGGRVKTINNAMVIYTNLGNQYNNNDNYGRINPPPPLPLRPYSLEYDNFQPITINGLPEFQGYYSCVDGLIVASNHSGGTMQQNMGTLLVKKNQASTPVVIGFHDHKITELTIDEQYSDASDIWSSILCYDYDMCADIIQYDETTNPPTTVIDKGLFNPLSFNAFKTTLKNVDVVVNGAPPGPYVYTTNQRRITELFNGEFVLVESKQSRMMTSALSKLHVLNTWGIDLSDDSTPFYKRIEQGEGGGGVNMKMYEMYINKVVDSIIGSAKKYYEDKIKNLLYDEEYGIITSSPPNIRFRRQGADNIVTGGGRREDAAAMIVAKQVELEEIKKLQRYNKNTEVRQIESTIEIRIPDIMMSNEYLAALSSSDEKEKARKYFFDALCKYSKKVKEIAIQENGKNARTNREKGNVVIKDVYKVVLCSSKLTEFKFENMYDDEKAVDKKIASVLSLSPDLYDYEEEVTNGVKNVIIVNEWNDRGFIGDYGAFASANPSSLTPNQIMISKTKANPGAANQVVEYNPKIANSSFLLNPFITYGSFDSSRWTGINSLDEKDDANMVQVGGGRDDELRRMQKQMMQEQQLKNAQYGLPYGLPYGAPYGAPYGSPYGAPYGDPFRQMSEYDYEGLMQRKVLEKTNASSSKLREDRTRMTGVDDKIKRVVLWLCDFREGKMLMVKTALGATNIMLSLPTQKQFTGAANISGYALLQELCRQYFQTEAVLTRWTLEHTYVYSPTGTGIFIYNAKTSELPKEKINMVYVSMKAIYKVATASEKLKIDGKEFFIFNSDKPIIVEIFKVVKLISGGIISSTSKEFNDVLARLGSKTVPPHLRSTISVTKRKNNVEANVNFLIKLFFSPNNLFFSRGMTAPYYIYSSQRNHKIYTIMKQQGYDDDSYLTCLKLFLQTETDFRNIGKGKSSNFRVGCAVKKKLITDNFSAVWDNFWGDLIESEEESKLDDQLAEDVGESEGIEGEEGKKDDKKDDKKDNAGTPSVCLELANQTGDRMYGVPYDWNVSKYWPIKYNDVYYNIRADEKHKFNNEYFYDLDRRQLTPHRRAGGGGLPDSYLGFKCMAYYKNGNNPILFLGDMGSHARPARQPGRVYKLDLNTHKLTKFIETNPNTNVLCMDILDVEGEDGYMLVGGNFTQITTYRYDDVTNDVIPVQQVAAQITVFAAMINLNTYEVIKLFNEALALPVVAGGNRVQKVCICKTKKIVKAKGGTQVEDVEGYIALIGGVFQINVTNDNNHLPPPANANNRELIENIGCVLIRKNANNPNNMEARLVAIDSKVALTAGTRSRVTRGGGGNLFIRSIVCQENEDKSETVFFVGGRFDTFNSIDYVAYEAAKATAAAGGLAPPARPVPADQVCNGIIKLSVKCEYDKDDNVSKYNQASVIEPILVNAVGNAHEIYFASLQYGIINSKKYLFCLTGFLNPPGPNVYTRLNMFDLESKLNVIQTPDILVPPLPPQANYYNQTLLLTKDESDEDNVQNVLIMSITTSNGVNPPFQNNTFTCNVSSLSQNTGAGARAIQVIQASSNGNANIGNDNIIMDMIYMEDTSEVYIAHQNVLIENLNRTEYPLTVRSNYQEIGEWKLKSESNEDEFDKFDDFIDKVIEMRKIFKLNPSMTLFLQYVDFRDYDNIDSKITKTRLETMSNDLISAAADVLAGGGAALPATQATVAAVQALAPGTTPVQIQAYITTFAPLLQATAAAAVKAAVKAEAGGAAQAAAQAAALAAAQAAAQAVTVGTPQAKAAAAAFAAALAASAPLAAAAAALAAAPQDKAGAVIRAVTLAVAGAQAAAAAAAAAAAPGAQVVTAITPGITMAVTAALITTVVLTKQNQIILDSPCNDVDKKIKNIMEFVYVLKTPSENLIIGGPTLYAESAKITDKIYNFINDLLFMLVYTGCNELAELICNNYVNLVIMPPPLVNMTTWRTSFDTVIQGAIGQFIEKIGKKAKLYKEKTRITPDISYDFKICSDVDIHTGVAYLVYNYNQNLNSLITSTGQNNLGNKIYEFGKDDFFDSNEEFYQDYITDNVGNSREKIKFCSFYKFDRLDNNAVPNPFNDIGNADSETVYVSVDISDDGINSGKVFEFLDVIRKYFKSLRSGEVIVDIGISGPIKRLTFGGDFGCNLLNDVDVCRKMKLNQMKIYTRKDNKYAFIDDADTDRTNHVFMIDVDLEAAGQVGGNKNQKRICIGERIEDKHRVLSNKRKTRRKVQMLLSSS